MSAPVVRAEEPQTPERSEPTVAAEEPGVAANVQSDDDEDDRCFVCGAVADGKLAPKCSKCGMVICRQHRDKNGFFSQYYTCFPCCRPVEARVPWREQRRRARLESRGRRRAQRARAAHENGRGDEFLPARRGDEGDERHDTTNLPVRQTGSPKTPQGDDDDDDLPVKPGGAKPPRLADGQANSFSKVSQWQQEVNTPTPSCSPGAGRDAPGSTSIVELWARATQPPPPGGHPPTYSQATTPVAAQQKARPAGAPEGGDAEEDLPVRADATDLPVKATDPSSSDLPVKADALEDLPVRAGDAYPVRADRAPLPAHVTSPPQLPVPPAFAQSRATGTTRPRALEDEFEEVPDGGPPTVLNTPPAQTQKRTFTFNRNR